MWIVVPQKKIPKENHSAENSDEEDSDEVCVSSKEIYEEETNKTKSLQMQQGQHGDVVI